LSFLVLAATLLNTGSRTDVGSAVVSNTNSSTQGPKDLFFGIDDSEKLPKAGY
jgi:hypothetical protein